MLPKGGIIGLSQAKQANLAVLWLTMETEININANQDQQAVKAVRAGDANRYRELVQRHERRVFAVAWSRLGDHALMLDWNGAVSAQLAHKDERALLVPDRSGSAAAADLQKQVAASVESAWRHFRKGDASLAEHAVGAG